MDALDSAAADDSLAPEDCRCLLGLARAAVEYGLAAAGPMPLTLQQLSPALRAPRACFVTLQTGPVLRGCVGSLEARRALAADAVHNAHAAAFRDPRFPPLNAAEWPGLSVSLSILSPPQPLPCTDEADLVAQLRPGIDGLVLEAGMTRCATFLPAVWEMLPDPRDFLRQLKAKAGLPAEYWSAALQFRRYTVQKAGD